MMSQQSKRELHAEVQPRYLKASKAEKEKFLDEFIAVASYHHKYANRILKRGCLHRRMDAHLLQLWSSLSPEASLSLFGPPIGQEERAENLSPCPVV